jgi:mRNA-degrading endonuclease toxin of MazEF toxin-antitoxin module
MFNAGDLAMVPVPFSDLSATKRRPVLILASPGAQDDFVAGPITSRSGRRPGNGRARAGAGSRARVPATGEME